MAVVKGAGLLPLPEGLHHSLNVLLVAFDPPYNQQTQSTTTTAVDLRVR
jgi:hypothetical protein